MKYVLPLILFISVMALPTAAQNAEDNTLRFGLPFRSGDYDPINESDDGELVFFDLVYDSLLTMAADGQRLPRLATSWDLTDETLEFVLRDDVVFSDGTPFDATVAQANLERAMTEGGFATRGALRAIVDVEVVDPYRLRLHHDNSDRFLLDAFTTYPGMMVSPQAFETTAQLPVGSGPYILNEDETIAGSLWIFDRNPNFWDADNIDIDRIEIRLTAQQDLVNGLLAGDLDGILITDSISRTLPPDGFTVLTSEVAFYALAFWDRDGVLVPELADPAVRCALSQAIDVALYNDAITGLAVSPMETIPPAHWYGASGVMKPAYDPQAARLALQEAGVEGLTLPLTTFPVVRNNHEALLGFLMDVGVTVDSIVRDNSEVYPYILAGNAAAGYINMNTKHFALFVETHIMPDGAWNPLNAFDEDIIALAEEARILPLEEAEPLYEEISQLINERCYFVPLSVGSTALYFTPEVEGAVGRYRTNGFVDMRALSLNR